jgi:hypothetical protein
MPILSMVAIAGALSCTELNPICKSQLAELFCGVFKLCAGFSKNLNISRKICETKSSLWGKESDIAQDALKML